MFGSLGLFSAVLCPQNGRCCILNCIFAHEEARPAAVYGHSKGVPLNSDLASVQPEDEPSRKRQRLSQDEETTLPPVGHSTPKNDTNTGLSTTQLSRIEIGSLNSLKKRVSPPPVTRGTSMIKNRALDKSKDAMPSPKNSQALDLSPKRQIKKETLNPRQLSKPPASHAIRMSILGKLHAAMFRLNEELKKSGDPSNKCLVLSTDELVSMALDEEEKIAKESPAVYSNVVKLRIVKLTKMKIPEWQDFVLTSIRPRNVPTTAKTPTIPSQAFSSELSFEEEAAIVSTLSASMQELKSLGCVTSPPSDDEIASAKRGLEASKGWEKCDRCNGRFQVFPGRREDGVLTSSGPCVYHYARPVRPPKEKTDHIVGQKVLYYPCCNETVGTSPGCTKVDSHVFKVTDTKRLAATMQFEKTPRQVNEQTLQPVCFDCEMGYTTLGLEMIRLTALSWPEGNVLIDVLVRPIGEILDLNTRYSGVRPGQFASATPYEPGKTFLVNGLPSSEANLQIVESPATARTLLFQFLQPETPLLGHALENDLNVCRIIHPTIVDTVLLYPHPGGLPLRNGLRSLAKRILGREIQAGGGSAGHDSIEDAKATGDLVRFKVGEKWQILKRSGWKIHNGKLVGPNTSAAPTSDGSGGTGVGLKRKALDHIE